MKSKVSFLLGIVAAVTLAVILIVGVFRTARAQSVVHDAFTIVGIQNYPDRDGTTIRTSVVTVDAVRGDGSQVHVNAYRNGEAIEVRRVDDVSRRQTVVIDPGTESIITYPGDDKWMRFLTAPKSCTGTAISERKTILGFETVKLTRDLGLNKVEERWVAPALQCRPLVIRSWRVDPSSGAKASIGSYDAVSVSLGQPDPALFNVPANFTERTPSQMFAEHARRTGKKRSECESRTGVALDEVYINARRGADIP